MDQTGPQITLVICTRNRAKKLDAFFASLMRLRCDAPWNLVIVDNGSTDDTAQRLKTFAATFPQPVTLVTEPRPGLGRARNSGWRATRAPVVAFTDDDCYPEPDYLNHVLAVYADEAVGFSGGRILLHDPTDARITIYEHTEAQTYPAESFIAVGVLQGANMSFRRQALEDINGFDDNLGAGTLFATEDADAELRALAAGWIGRYDPRSVVYHHHGRKPGPEVDRLSQGYDSGRGAYYMKCILFTPQRWQCLRYWLRGMPPQSFGRNSREVIAAIRYVFYQFRQKPNVTY